MRWKPAWAMERACLWLRTREAPKPQDVVREPRHIMTLRRKGDVITAAAILIEGS